MKKKLLILLALLLLACSAAGCTLDPTHLLPWIKPTPVPDPWETSFTYQRETLSAVLLTRFNDGTQGSGEGIYSFTDDGLRIQRGDKGYADTYHIYSGANLSTADYSGCTYVGLRLKSEMSVESLFGLQGTTVGEKPIFLSEEGETIILADAAGIYRAYGQSGVNGRYCVEIPAQFDGYLLIPTGRIVDSYIADEAQPWRRSPIEKLGFHLRTDAAEGMLVQELFLYDGSLTQPVYNACITNPDYSYTDAQRIAPFWEQDVMYNECVAFTETDDGIYGTTLFVPSEIISVVDMRNRVEYYPGVDFNWVEGTNRIEWVEGSSIPYFYKGALAGKAAPDSDELVSAGDEQGRSIIGSVLHCTGRFLYSRQFCVTYRYDRSQAQQILHTPYQGYRLSRTLDKLENNENLRILFYGDSIFSGCDASSLHKRAPFMPKLSQLVASELQQHTEGTVTMDNISVGGWSVGQGLQALSGPVNGVDYSDAYQGYDLLVLSFGMNNGGSKPENFQATTKAIIDTVREANPDIEIILVSCMNPNPESTFYGNQKYFGECLYELADDHTAVVDFFRIHQRVLQYKSFVSTSGNNINHPNDWLIRLYAQNILAALFPAESGAGDRTGSFLYGDQNVTTTVLTDFRDGFPGGSYVLTSDGLTVCPGGERAVYSGGSLQSADYSTCAYLGLCLENRTNADAVLCLDGRTIEGHTLSLTADGEELLLVNEAGESFAAQTSDGITIPANFSGVLLIPAGRIADNAEAVEPQPWAKISVAELGISVSASEGVLLKNVFLADELPVSSDESCVNG